jgi:thiamine-phosphate pyrophosphorylase
MDARQQSWPRIWLMTDERMGDRLWQAIARLPRGAGIVFRHYSLPFEEREELARRISLGAQLGGFTLAVAGDAEMAKRVGAELVHKPRGFTAGLPFSLPVHSLDEAESARTEGSALVFVSPVFATRSHPGQVPLGVEVAGRIARAAGTQAIALGGMNAQNFAALQGEGFHGWAGIDAWLGART